MVNRKPMPSTRNRRQTHKSKHCPKKTVLVHSSQILLLPERAREPEVQDLLKREMGRCERGVGDMLAQDTFSFL